LVHITRIYHDARSKKTLNLYFYIRGIHWIKKKYIIPNCLIHVATYKIIKIFCVGDIKLDSFVQLI